MARSNPAPGFSLIGFFTSLAVVAGVAAVCVPLVARRVEARARGARASIERLENSLAGGIDRIGALAGAYARSAPAGPSPVLPADPPFSNSPVEFVEPWRPLFPRPRPRFGRFPEWRGWRAGRRPRACGYPRNKLLSGC